MKCTEVASSVFHAYAADKRKTDIVALTAPQHGEHKRSGESLPGTRTPTEDMFAADVVAIYAGSDTVSCIQYGGVFSVML